MQHIEKGAYVHPTAILGPNVWIGEGAYIGPFCIIGYAPEWKTRENDNKGVIIGPHARLTGMVTVDGGAERETIIGADCYLMKQTHVGHDAVLEDQVTLSPGARIGGHTVVGLMTNVGMNATIHQRLRIPPSCMIGMGAVVTKKTELKQGMKYAGVPARIIGENVRPDQNKKFDEMIDLFIQRTF